MIENFRKFINNTIKNLTQALQSDQTDEKSKGKAIRFFLQLVDDLKENITIPLDLLIKKPGYFYLMTYESKLYKEKKLRFYDQYPLVFILAVQGNYFWGINMHYLTARQKHAMMKKLILRYPEQFVKDKRLIPINWKIYKSLMNNKKYIKNAIKCYRFDQLKRIRGLKAARIRNIDVIEAMKFVSQRWIGETSQNIAKWVRQNKIPEKQKL